MLDISTIIIFMAIIHTLCAVVLMFLWMQNRTRYKGTGFWAADLTLIAAGLLLIVLRDVVPFWMTTVLATTMILGGAIILYRGLGIFLNVRTRLYHYIAMLALFAFIHGYYAFVEPSLAVRNLVLSVFWLTVSLQTLWLLFFRINPALRMLALKTGIAVSLYAVINAARIINFFFYPNPQYNYLRSGLFEAIVLISFQMATILLTYSLSLMVNRRLSMDIEAQEEKYSKAFYTAPYAVILTHKRDGRIIEANKGFEEMTGYTVAEATGKTTLELNLYYDEDERKTFLKKLDENSTIRDNEIRFRTRTGEILIGMYSSDAITVGGKECILSSISDITGRKLADAERERMITELKEALSEIKTLSGMLPICSSCKKIRNDSGYWQQIESYIREHSGAEFSHSICPECMHRLYPDFSGSIISSGESPDKK